jgi:hypothetical protein
MISLRKLKTVKSNFPIMIAEKAIPKNICRNFVKEIQNSKVFDDMIMGGRSRINKGSQNFKNFIKNSKNASKLYKQFNNFNFYNKIENIFKKRFKDNSWSSIYQACKFQKEKFTAKKKYNSNELKKILRKKNKKPRVNLDIDFSVSKGGYRLRPHRDDITRQYNFLIYLNDIPKLNGGSLTVYKKKIDKKIIKSFRRFPKISELNIVKEFTPKRGTVIFFQSTPNSYHGVKRFVEYKGQNRYFIYGSYAFDQPIVWQFKNINYYPKIKFTKKKMLSSFHESNYTVKKAVN